MKLTGEHVLRNWLRRAMPEIEARTSWQRWVDDAGVIREEEREIPESPFDQRSRTVCGHCNSGWMNDIEQAVGDPLVEMIQGARVSLEPARAVRLAGWAAKTAAVRGRVDKGTATVRTSDCQKIRRTRRPPLDWQVWLGQTSAVDVVSVSHGRRALDWSRTPGGDVTKVADLHITVMVLGRLLIAVVGCAGDHRLAKGLQAGWRDAVRHSGGPVMALWPPTAAQLAWPPDFVHEPEHVAQLYGLLDQFLNEVNKPGPSR